ncbi:phospholipase A [Billgrantia kenyensis]|uniref:Phospholipase A1 n=1 Tax=Billgrantia kenyensis TaxID=321266 RepID=A0A7V9W3B0_9GAMM|nr:phospholipase A [Halomonas kenyensis]MBA2780192.1 phospholipase A [Halomonas kenyensis]MCG6663152.1 phospholipase [Halomonas kenyensis]
MIIRSLVITCGGLLAALPISAMGQADAQREAIEARIEALSGELEALQLQLDALPQDDDALYVEVDDPVLEEVVQRRQLERESTRNPLAITVHRRNYLFPLSYTTHPNQVAFRDIDADTSANDLEVKFQFSAKVNLLEEVFGTTGDLYFAYTQRSWWQAYNTDASSPFRETNYEPEVFLEFDNTWRFLGWTNTRNRFAFNHLSNGRSMPLSRSWNRFYVESMFQRGDWAVAVAPHWRVPESDGDDDNPNIDRYWGYGDITVVRRFNNDQEASVMVRGNPSPGNYGTQVDYSWPLFGNIRGHVQYYYGYGESMIDYDHRNHRLSLGFSVNPLLSGTGGVR